MGGILPFARESLGFMVMDLFDGRIEMRRYCVDDMCEMTPPSKRWSLHWPYDPARRVSLRVPANSLEPGRTYRVSVHPRNWFGQEGAPLGHVFAINPNYRFRNVDESYPQE